MNHHKKTPKLFKDWNEHLTVPAIIVLALLVVLLSLLTSCQKESSFTAPSGVIESDKHLVPPGGYNLAKRDVTPELQMASKKVNPGKGKGKPGGDTTGTDEPQPPTYSGQGVILLDFDGQYVSGTYWNANGPIEARYSGMSEAEIAATLQRVQSDYAEFAVTVTTDTALYWAAPLNKRIRVIITESWEWYGQAGGVAYVNSFTWGDNTPAWVFSSLLGYNAKNIADAVSHEAGHTLGLRHQARWEGGVKVEEYNSTIAADGKGYLMGYPYPHISGWQTGVNPYGAVQDDPAIMRSTLAL